VIGDQADFVYRIKAVLPTKWFPDVTPILDGILNGLASSWASLYSALAYVKAQTRLATATGVNLDLFSVDFFGLTLPRFVNESDTQYRARIRRELLRPRGTRAALIGALTDLTGRVPLVFEPANTGDTGGYGVAMGYGVAGAYGSLLLPFQCFVTAYRPTGAGIANVAGYGASIGGYGVGAIEYGSMSFVTGQVLDSAIYDAAARTMPAATICWMRISS